MSGLVDVRNIERLKEHGGNIRRLAEKFGVDPVDLVDFSSNINPYGPPQCVIDAVRSELDKIGDYPEQQAEGLVGVIAQSLGIDVENVVAGNGTIELIYLIPQAFKSTRALLIVPSFTEYELSLNKAGAEIVYREAMSAEDAIWAIEDPLWDAGIAMIGNPNNPCGYKIEKDRLLKIIDNRANCLWAIDEAFVDFTRCEHEISLVKESIERENLIVLRSLTKIFSIAGLRLGYMVASSSIAAKVREEKYPWSINSLALAAGAAALKDKGFIAQSVDLLAEEANRLYGSLSGISKLTVYEPSANYILVKIESDTSSLRIQEELLRRGIAVRDCSSYTGMDDRHFRIAVKRPEDNDRLTEALREVLS